MESDAGIDSGGLRPGMVVGGKFALLRQLGEGGVGVVFEAEDTWIGRRVALKVLHSHLVEEDDVIARFRREARAAAMTNHPNIVAVFEVGAWRDGAPYIVQELLHGETLRDRLVRDGRLTATDAIEILVPIMGALAVAHRAGIVHRDIKPENIFLAKTHDGSTVPKLIDFGIAKIASSELQTLRGKLVGTPMYMSPEQVSGARSADHRTDIWAVGAVIYEMLSDHCPHEGPSTIAVLHKILTEPIRPLVQRVAGIPPELSAIVQRALEHDRERRYASMDEFLRALLAYAQHPDPTISARHAASIPDIDAELVPSSRPSRLGTPLLGSAEGAVREHTARTLTSGMSPDDRPLPRFSDPSLTNADAEPPVPEAREAGEAREAVAPPDSGPPPPRFSLRPIAPEWARPMVQPELGWFEGRASRAPRDLGWYTAAAGEALRDNALDEAVDHAEHAITTCHATGKVLGQMRLVQAIALRWLGHYADAERAALEAAEHLPRQTPGWYTAIGHIAMLGGYLGKNDRFPGIVAELAELEASGPVGAEHVVTACRLAVSLVRAGHVQRASRCLGTARAAAEAGLEDEPMVRAWIFVAVAEIAAYRGQPTTYIQYLESAVLGFSESGDVRNACLQRANIANGYMQLGAYARARSLMREVLGVGEPLRLGFIVPVRANLGFVLARLGDVDQALEIEQSALEVCIRERYKRFEVASRIYLGVISWLRGDLARAEDELRLAATASIGYPDSRAYALANLADLCFEQGRTQEACAAASEAGAVLEALEGVEEGESLIRLVHALALEAVGDLARAGKAISEARRRLLERADRITDARLRRSFLDHIPENARTLTVATRLRAAAP